MVIQLAERNISRRFNACSTVKSPEDKLGSGGKVIEEPASGDRRPGKPVRSAPRCFRETSGRLPHLGALRRRDQGFHRVSNVKTIEAGLKVPSIELTQPPPTRWQFSHRPSARSGSSTAPPGMLAEGKPG